MDRQTVEAYDRRASDYAAGYLAVEPTNLYRLLLGWFRTSGTTLDIGCGSGRDAAWLSSRGFPTTGLDASAEMLRAARSAFPELALGQDCLPDLATVADASFDNVLCSAVLMHLSREHLVSAVLALARILRPTGRLALCYRTSKADSEREADGRLFSDIPVGKLTLLLESAGFQVLAKSREQDASRRDVAWEIIVAEKGDASPGRGIDRVQKILMQDAKTATYKLALVRSLCVLSRTESHVVSWGEGEVYVPLWSIAVQWLAFYWPIVNAAGRTVAQIRGEERPGSRPIAFRPVLQRLATAFGAAGLWAALRAIDEDPERYRSALRVIADTIRKGPVTYAGTRDSPVFQYVGAPPHESNAPQVVRSMGWVAVPEPIWLDISRFDHWIEDSVVLQWAILTASMNSDGSAADYLPLLLGGPGAKRDTDEVRGILAGLGDLRCVWTGRRLAAQFEVDHTIPYSVWGNNDLWNLLPCTNAVNRDKSDALPSLRLVRQRAKAIVDYWAVYRDAKPRRFGFQLARALGCLPGDPNWERAAIAGLEETLQRLFANRGLRSWEP